MPAFDSEGVRIAYEDVGSGRAIVLVHGFAADRRRNWKDVGWFDELAGAGRRVVALDCRGHGESDKPHDPSAYSGERMSGDVVHLMDHLGIERGDLMGYSMGGRIAAVLLARHAHRFEKAVLGGVGGGMVGERRGAEAIARALEASDAAAIKDPTGQAFRAFAEQAGNDLRALAACMRGLRHAVDAGDIEKIHVPVLIVAGEQDTIVGDPQRLASLITGARLVTIPGRDHLTAVGDRRYKEAVLQFLAG
jgi:pimeloyl-ACP methyl ester carboxylesterase